MAAQVLQAVCGDAAPYGEAPGNGQVVCIDFSSPNIAKPFHIGHMRSTVLGNALCRIHRHLGAEVHGINHLGDWGAGFARLARGQDLREVEPYRGAVSMSEENTFASDVSERRVMEAAIWSHAEAVACRLRKTGKVADTVVLKLKLGQRVAPGPRGYPLLTRRSTLREPTDDGDVTRPDPDREVTGGDGDADGPDDIGVDDGGGVTEGGCGDFSGDFMCPCTSNRDCASGFCIPTDEGLMCTVACVDVCPVDCLTITDNGERDELAARTRAPLLNPAQPLYVSAPLVQTGRVMVKDENLCVHCGLCAARCPTAAWDMQKSKVHAPHATDAGRSAEQWKDLKKAG